jgi:hypothetical protein
LVTSEANTSFNSQFLFLESDIKGGGKAKQETKKCHEKKTAQNRDQGVTAVAYISKNSFWLCFPNVFWINKLFLADETLSLTQKRQ